MLLSRIAARVRPAYRGRHSTFSLVVAALLGVEATRSHLHSAILAAFLFVFIFVDFRLEEDANAEP